MPAATKIHVAHLGRRADAALAAIESRARLSASLPARPLRRRTTLAGQWIVRKGKELVQEHWDLALFDVSFGCVKAFGIYPALYFAGLTWTIPLMEYAPLNTQLWTAGYLFARRQLLSRIGRARYGRGLIELDRYRDRALRIAPADARSIHRFEADGTTWTVRVRRGRLRGWLRRLRKQPPEPNVLGQHQLRALVANREFAFHANPLRSNAHFYEAVLLRRILASDARGALLARLTPEPVLTGADRDLLEALGETSLPTVSRVIEQGDALTAALRERLGSGFSATAMALRWINWSHQRAIYRLLARQARHEYQLLTDRMDGTPLADSAHREPLRAAQAEIETWMERADGLGERVRALRTKRDAHALIDREIVRARALGLPVRLARIARRASPSGRRQRAATGALRTGGS